MPEQIGLEAVLEDAQFRQGLNNYLSGIDAMNTATGNAAKQGQSLWGKLSNAVTSFGMNARQVGGLLSVGVTAPLALIGGTAIKTAADFESSLNLMQAVSGSTAEQMAVVSQRAKDLGADMALPGTSAATATDAMVELAKAGLSVQESMDAARGTIQLAAAGALSEAEAAETTANALNSFGLAGTEATRVADLLAASANASSAEVADVGAALRQASAVAASAGVPIEDLVTSISLMANAGVAGSDAGTSLKTTLLRLQAPTKKSAALMKQLGVDVFDAQGAMLPMREIIGQFTRATADMTQEQKNATLATLFGTDAIRAAQIVLTAGTDDWDKMSTAVNKQGAASELAGARMKGLGGALEGLKSQVETLLIDAALPFLGFLEKLVRQIAEAVGGLLNLPAPIKNAALAFAGVLASAGPILLFLGKFISLAGLLINPLSLVAVAVAGLAAAFAGNFFGIRDIVTGAINSILPVIENIIAVLGDLGNYFRLVVKDGDFLNTFLTKLPAPMQPVIEALGRVVTGVIALVQQFQAFGSLSSLADFPWENIFPPTVANAIYAIIRALVEFETMLGAAGAFITTNIVPALGELVTWLSANLPGAIAAAAGLFQSTLLPAFAQVGPVVLGLIPVLQDLVTNVVGAVNQIVAAFSIVVPSLEVVFNAALAVIVPAVLTIVSAVESSMPQIQAAFVALGPVIEAVKDLFVSLAPIVGAALVLLASVVVGVFNGLAQAIGPAITLITNLIQSIALVLTGVVNSVSGLLDILVGLFTNNSELIRGGLAALQTGIEQIFTGITTGIINLIRDMIYTVYGLIKGFVDGVLGFFRSLFNQLVGASIIPDMINKIISSFNLLNDLKQIVQGIVDGIVGVFSGLFSRVTEILGSLVGKAKELLGGIFGGGEAQAPGALPGLTLDVSSAEEIREKMRAVFSEITQFVTQSWAAIAAVTVATLGNMGIAVTENLATVKTAFVDSWQAAVDATLAALSVIVNAVINQLSTVATFVQSSLIAVLNNWILRWTEIRVFTEQTWASILLTTQTMLTTMLSVITVGLNTIMSLWISVWNSILAFMETTRDRMIQIMLEAANGMRDALFSVDWYGVGVTIADSVARGISDTEGRIVDAARNAARSAYEAALAELGIGSPSKLFVEVGKEIDAGWAKGIEQGMTGVVGAMRSLVTSALNTSKPVFSVPQSAGIVAGARTTNINRTINVEVNPTYTGSRSPNTIFLDITAALAAARA